MDFNKRAMEYITNEKEMLEVLEKISEQMKKRAEMERQEPSLLALRCFSLELRDIEEVRKKKEAENKRKADDERIRAEKKKERKNSDGGSRAVPQEKGWAASERSRLQP